jgi:DNA-binding GntR family transcriptional regulator
MNALNPALEINWNEFAHSSLSEALYASLHAAIVEGRILPGTLLREVEVSRNTNVSRTPVREAFRKLESERLLLRTPGRKFVVASPNRGEIEEIFLVRSVLEGLAGRIACSKMNPGHIAELKKIVRNMEKGRRDHQIDLVIKSNLEFHRLIVEVCRNNVLAQTLNRLWDTVRMLSMSSLGNRGWIPNAVRQHKEIIAALEKNEALSVERLIRDHVIHAGRTLQETQGAGKRNVTSSASRIVR